MLIVSKRREKVCQAQKIFKPKHNIDRLFLNSKNEKLIDEEDGIFKHNINFLGENKVCQSAGVLTSN